jgi:hypothetical protein
VCVCVCRCVCTGWPLFLSTRARTDLTQGGEEQVLPLRLGPELVQQDRHVASQVAHRDVACVPPAPQYQAQVPSQPQPHAPSAKAAAVLRSSELAPSICTSAPCSVANAVKSLRRRPAPRR